MPEPTDGPHGLPLYRTGKCRCEVCRAANARRFREDQADRVARLKADPTCRQHGLAATYVHWGCRCVPCRDAAGKGDPQLRSTPRSPWKRKRDPRRGNLMYVQRAKSWRNAEPFGREWLDDKSVRSA